MPLSLNPRRPCGECLPGFRGSHAATKQTSTHILGGPAATGTPLEAELEAELLRLELEMQRLETFNGELRRVLETEAEAKPLDVVDDCDNGESPDGHAIDVSVTKDMMMSQESVGENAEEPLSAGTDKAKLKRAATKTRVVVEDSLHDPVPIASSGAPRTSNSLSRWVSSWSTNIHGNLAGSVNSVVLKGSALGAKPPVKALIFAIALGFLLFVLIATSTGLGVAHHDDEGDAHHRRLGGGTSPLMKNIAFTVTTAGLMTFIVHFFHQPIILGYILGGVLVGPIGLNIVHSHHDIAELSSLGLIFLLFMIGLEIDIHQLFSMDKRTLLTGALQYPICFGLTYGFVLILWLANFEFGPGTHATLYCAMSAGLSSTMIIAKLLDQKGDTESPSGRMTMGVLFCQDIWAIIVLVFQPEFALSPDPLEVFKETCIKILMLFISLAYAKFIMPAVLQAASKSVELMLVMSLAWCFFICSACVMPFIGISMELAALTSGIALATFPYSAEFNSKIKYIRDFFITLFFAGLGMMIPVPTFAVVAKALLLAAFAVFTRGIGVFCVVRLTGGSNRLASLSTLNLAQMSEFGLVFCEVGLRFGHIDTETLVIILWAFALLHIINVYMVNYNYEIFRFNHRVLVHVLGRKITSIIEGQEGAREAEEEEEEARDIVLVGFHRIAMLLLTEFEMKSPELLKKVHVIDYDQDTIDKLRKRGVKGTFVNDISHVDALKVAEAKDAKMIICTIPDSMLRGTSNLEILRCMKQVWPRAHYILTADNPSQAKELYDDHADYVLRMAKLCAERLYVLLSEYEKAHIGEAGSQLEQIFNHYKRKDRTGKTSEFTLLGG